MGKGLIFTLVAERLNMMMKMVEMRGIVAGLHVNKRKSIMNLQYAVDMLIFGKTSLEQAILLKWLLCSFETWSELKINFNKSQLVFMENQDIRTNII